MDHPLQWADKYRQQLAGEFQKLLAESHCRTPSVGDHVLVAAGLLGKGHPWVRRECVVVEVGETAVKVHGDDGEAQDQWEEWIHPALITDILAKK